MDQCVKKIVPMENINQLLIKTTRLLKSIKLTIATAESCTGGLLAAYLTDLPGSSAWFDRGFVTYSNQAKTDLLGVPFTIIQEEGAVSQSVAQAMAQGALNRSAADIAIAVTGIAGPDGGSLEKPVGTVWLALATMENIYSQQYQFGCLTRQEIRKLTCEQAFLDLCSFLTKKG